MSLGSRAECGINVFTKKDCCPLQRKEASRRDDSRSVTTCYNNQRLESKAPIMLKGAKSSRTGRTVSVLPFSALLSLLLLLPPILSFTASHNSRGRQEIATSRIDRESVQPYQGQQPAEALPEIFVPNVMPNDERLWVPQTDSVSFYPLCLCVSAGYYVNLLRVKGSGLLSRHRHPGPVHGHVLKGRWKYLEHDWEAMEGSYIFEPPGETHTLVVPEGVDEMITLFHVTGSLLYCDEDGKVVGVDDVFTKLELAKQHYARVGLGQDFAQQFVR